MLSQGLTGQLVRDPYRPDNNDTDQINSLENPPLIPLKSEEILVRKCRLASDRMDSRFGRFRTEDLPNLLEMIQGAPVLIGHDRKSLGIARFFGGEIAKRGDTTWIIPKFYWAKDHSGAEDLRIQIDAGVYNEASIAFVYQKPTCSVCGEDLRSCPHWPGKTYEGELCFYWYDKVERVTEGSLVYRGAAPGTGIELVAAESDETRSMEANKTDKKITIKHRGKRYTAQLYPLIKDAGKGEMKLNGITGGV